MTTENPQGPPPEPGIPDEGYEELPIPEPDSPENDDEDSGYPPDEVAGADPEE